MKENTALQDYGKGKSIEDFLEIRMTYSVAT